MDIKWSPGVIRLSTAAALLGALTAIAGVSVGCKPGNAPGPKDDIVVHAPGVFAKSDDQGVLVRAPLGIEVRVDAQGVAVKAPGVDVQSDAKGVVVNAPLGVTVRTGGAQQP
jgi:hypothetical protein